MSRNVRGADPRAARTRQSLREALVALIMTKGYSAITVRDLAGWAMLNRATFYRHFRDKDDLLEWTITSMLDHLTGSIEPLPREVQPHSLPEALHAWVRVLEQAAANAPLYRTMLGPKGSPVFADRVRRYLEDLLLQRLQDERGQIGGPGSAPPGIPDQVVAAFVAGAFLGTIERWLEAGMPHPPRQLAGWLAQLLVLGSYRPPRPAAPHGSTG